MKLNYQSYAFSSAHKIEFIYEGKPLLAFSNKETSTLTIPVIYSPSEFSNQRQAFENAYKNLTFKLWVFEKSQKSIRMDLGKLRTLSVAPGTCAVNISNLEDIITDSPADTPATIEQKVLPTAPPVLPAHPSVPPTRSAHHEKSPSLIQYSNTEPTR
ncbi:MAG: hypothetical protein JNL11_11470 [Bdellovibrionaceae bacterium]|nr:hypothetical protein [Pseudobdellovibrionaceae bacterium]